MSLGTVVDLFMSFRAIVVHVSEMSTDSDDTARVLVDTCTGIWHGLRCASCRLSFCTID